MGLQLERFLDLFLLRDPQAATTQPSFLNYPRLSLGDELSNGPIRDSHVTRHKSPLSMGDRSETTGETLGSEVCSTTSQLDDARVWEWSTTHSRRRGGTNATESEGPALHGLGPKKQPKSKGCRRLLNQAGGVMEHHGSHTVMCRIARMGSWDYTEVLIRSRFGTVCG